MSSNIMDTICSQVYSQFPDLKGVKPQMQKMSGPGTGNILLIFKGSSRTASGKSLPRVVRVVASETGKVIKMTTSH
ncbi:MAG: hypothetical protein JW704_07330 [Anaerolineaceae bacterium]|nr:hypothetical protein [Anaerolineaceae bacterium]